LEVLYHIFGHILWGYPEIPIEKCRLSWIFPTNMGIYWDFFEQKQRFRRISRVIWGMMIGILKPIITNISCKPSKALPFMEVGDKMHKIWFQPTVRLIWKINLCSLKLKKME